MYLEDLTDEHQAENYFADLPSTYERRNPFIFSNTETNTLRTVNLWQAYDGVMPKFVQSFYLQGRELLSSCDRVNSTELIRCSLAGNGQIGKDFESAVENSAPVVTMTIVADLNEPSGLELVKSAMQLLVRFFPSLLRDVH